MVVAIQKMSPAFVVDVVHQGFEPQDPEPQTGFCYAMVTPHIHARPLPPGLAWMCGVVVALHKARSPHCLVVLYCKRGRHRSVGVTEILARYFRPEELEVLLVVAGYRHGEPSRPGESA